MQHTDNTFDMYKNLIQKLLKENSQLAGDLLSYLQKVSICLSCGNRDTEDVSTPVLALSNEREEFGKSFSVTLKIIYIFEADQCKKYEIRLKPGEYLYNEIIGKIKEKVQVDRYYVKLCKRTFLLVDLFDNT